MPRGPPRSSSTSFSLMPIRIWSNCAGLRVRGGRRKNGNISPVRSRTRAKAKGQKSRHLGARLPLMWLLLEFSLFLRFLGRVYDEAVEFLRRNPLFLLLWL